jgi:hypothetical protein
MACPRGVGEDFVACLHAVVIFKELLRLPFMKVNFISRNALAKTQSFATQKLFVTRIPYSQGQEQVSTLMGVTEGGQV